mmetsp:Transcript_79459/g.199722  ORF Transcript_79459/g.199722 Transcript_79459/m.199722 type:complete len:87 (+) Transcript_79459:45-305(+)
MFRDALSLRTPDKSHPGKKPLRVAGLDYFWSTKLTVSPPPWRSSFDYSSDKANRRNTKSCKPRSETQRGAEPPVPHNRLVVESHLC